MVPISADGGQRMKTHMGISGLLFGVLIIVAGFVVYGLTGRLRGSANKVTSAEFVPEQTA